MRRESLERFRALCPLLRVPLAGIHDGWAELGPVLRAIFGGTTGQAIRFLQVEQSNSLWVIADPSQRRALAAIVTSFIPYEQAWAECEPFVCKLWPDHVLSALRVEADRGDCVSIEMTVPRALAPRLVGWRDDGSTPWYAVDGRADLHCHRGLDVLQVRQPFKASPRAPMPLAH